MLKIDVSFENIVNIRDRLRLQKILNYFTTSGCGVLGI